MIAAARRRIRTATRRAARRIRSAPAGAVALSRRVDRAVDRQLRRAWPPLARAARRLQATGRRLGRRLGQRLRPAGVLLFGGLARLERRLLRAAARARRTATGASAVLTPERAVCVTILAAAACLIASQFVDYRAVEVGQPGYAGLPAATPPTVAAETAGEAHAYLLVPVALLAAALALAVLRDGRRTKRGQDAGGRPVPGALPDPEDAAPRRSAAGRARGFSDRRLGRIVFALGALSLAVALLVDLPAGLDESAQAARFSGATAVLYDGFYAELAAAFGLMLGGALLVGGPKARWVRAGRRRHRPRKRSLARPQAGRRSVRTFSVRE